MFSTLIVIVILILLERIKIGEMGGSRGGEGADDDPFIVIFGFSIPSTTKKKIKFGPPLTKLSGLAHGRGV